MTNFVAFTQHLFLLFSEQAKIIFSAAMFLTKLMFSINQLFIHDAEPARIQSCANHCIHPHFACYFSFNYHQQPTELHLIGLITQVAGIVQVSNESFIPNLFLEKNTRKIHIWHIPADGNTYHYDTLLTLINIKIYAGETFSVNI